MDVSIENLISATTGETESGQARYKIIADALRSSIASGRAPQGLVLLEAPLARIFGTSRVPVRQALGMLSDEGCLHRFSGRGYLVGSGNPPVTPLRRAVDDSMFATATVAEVKNLKPVGERLYETLLAEVSAFIVFGRYRIDERVVMEAMSVGRNLVRESMSRLADQQLIIREPYGQWQTLALTARALADEFELRAALQPSIIRARCSFYDPAKILGLLTEASAAVERPEAEAAERVLVGLNDLLFGVLENRKIQWALAQCNSAALLDSYLRRVLPTLDDRVFLHEIIQVLKSLAVGDAAGAATAYLLHLREAELRALERLKVLAVLPEPQAPSYLIKV